MGEREPLPPRVPRRRRATDGNEEWVRGIITGDTDAIDRLSTVAREITDGPFPILPPHTLTIDVEIGANLDEERRRIRQG
jgi:hypothetical protein